MMLKFYRDFVTNFAAYQSFSTFISAINPVLDLRLSRWCLKSYGLLGCKTV
jgi:hypothetical protein